MKKLILLITIVLFTISSHGQIWTYEQGGNAFDGKYKTSSIVGVGYEFPYTKPLFVINIFKGEVTDPNIYLTRVPSGACDNHRVLIKFDNDDKIYTPDVTISNNDDNWFLDFSGLTEVMDSINKPIKYYILPSEKPVKIRSRPDANSAIINELSSKDTIDLIYYDVPYWVCRYKDKIVYMHEMYLTGVQKYSLESDKEVYVPFKRMTDDNIELNLFIKDLKTHSVMNIRLLSDCVKSDFKFSLKGSTAAINFVFAK